MLLGVAAFTASAFADGAFVNVTREYVQEPCYLPGWEGMITGYGEGVAEVWNGAFRAYQDLGIMPAGEYTLTADALYRCGANKFAKAHQEGNADLNTCFIFANDAKKTVKGLFEGGRESAPNWLGEANEAFTNGEYENTLTFNHDGGRLVIGICNTGCYYDEWCAFDNFKLVGPNGPVELENGDFATGLDAKRAWDNFSSENKEKTPDMQKDGAGGGTYRKCGGSPYNYGQQITLPAGKYRWGMCTFHRYGSTVNPETGDYYHHKSGEIVDPYPRTPKQWFDAQDYDTQDYDHAYIYVSFGESKPKILKSEEEFGDLGENDLLTRVKDVWEICNGNVAEMPDNNPYGVADYHWNDRHNGGKEGEEADAYFASDDDTYYANQGKNKCIYWHDSGDERETAGAFVADPDKYFQYVEFELPAETTLWIGMGKDSNTSDGYYQPWGYQSLLQWDENEGVKGMAVDADLNAPVEYFNLQGIRVANPTNGLYIVKQGKKAHKEVIRK